MSEGESEYMRRCFSEYGVMTDNSGRYACIAFDANVLAVKLRREMGHTLGEQLRSAA